MSGVEAKGPTSKSQSRKNQSCGRGEEGKWVVEMEWAKLTTVDARRGVV